MRISVDKFGVTPKNEQVDIVTIESGNGSFVKLTNYGAKLVALVVPDRLGNLNDVVLGYNNLDGYLSGNRYFGSNPGRFANRIKGAQFTIEGITYKLPANEGENLLHGGDKAFDGVVWNYEIQDNGVSFQYLSPDGENGFPGALDTTITYRWTNDLELIIDYRATTDKPTHVNLTHHSYFNLDGESAGSIADHIISINASHYLEVGEGLIPTGRYLSVEGTPLDLRMEQRIGNVVDSDFPVMKSALGFDHCYVIDHKDSELSHCAHVYAPKSGRTMEVYSTLPGLQFYSCNHVASEIAGKSGVGYPIRSSLCLEPQFFPNTPNIGTFPSTLLVPNQEYKQTVIYQFNFKTQ